MKRRKVTFIMPSLVGGGAERTLINVLIALDRTKFEPTLFLQKRVGAFLGQVPPDVKIYFGSEPPKKTSKQLSQFICEFIKSIRNADVIVGYLELTPGYLAALAGILLRKPALAMVHVNLDFYLTEVAPWHSKASKLLYPFLKGIVFCSQAGLNSFKKAILRHPNMLQVVHNPIDLDAVRQDAQLSLPDIAKCAVSKPFLLGVGRLERQKGFEFLIKAFEQVIKSGFDYHLVILGDGPDLSQLQKLAQLLNIADRVFLLGFTQNPFPYFKAAEAFVLSSRFEGMPTVVIEAMAIGVPVVCFDGKSGTSELFQNGRSPGILVPAEDIQKLANGVIQISQQPELRKKCIEDGFHVSEQYLMKNAIEEWELILTSV